MLNLFLTYLDDELDKKLFEDMYNNYRKQMVALAMTLVKNHDDAEDVVHSVFLRIAQKNWDTVREIENDIDLRNYLLKSTKNASLNMLDLNKKDNVSLDANPEAEYEAIENMSNDDFFKMIESKIDYKNVREAINNLDSKYKDPLYYHLVCDFPVIKVAKLLGQTVPTTQKQLVRGKKMLLNLLDIEGV